MAHELLAEKVGQAVVEAMMSVVSAAIPQIKDALVDHIAGLPEFDDDIKRHVNNLIDARFDNAFDRRHADVTVKTTEVFNDLLGSALDSRDGRIDRYVRDSMLTSLDSLEDDGTLRNRIGRLVEEYLENNLNHAVREVLRDMLK